MIDVRNIEGYKKKGQCFAITSYCNTRDKIGTLASTIHRIKKYELPIFLHAHYPIPSHIQSLVDFYYYSSDNPIFNRFNTFWEPVDEYRLEITEYDFFYTTLKGWNESIKIMSEYEKIHMINYDTNLYPELFKKGRDNNKSMFLLQEANWRDMEHMFLLYFSLTKDYYEDFQKEITLDKYLGYWAISKSQFIPSIEEMLGSFLDRNRVEILHYDHYDKDRMMETNESTDARLSIHKISSTNDINVFIGEYNKTTHILFYNVDKPKTIHVKVNGLDYMEQEITEPTTLVDLKLLFKGEPQFKLFLDGQAVDDEFINRFYRLETKISRV